MYQHIFVGCFLCGALVLAGCDLQPKISSIPDSIGEFISQRYPALLADPESQPEIYNSAVTDYGVYASPELYGSENVQDYVMYASVDDYVLVPSDDNESQDKKSEITNAETKTEVLSTKSEDYLVVPEYTKPKEDIVQKTDAADFVVVARGDTLYSVARKNNTSVSELAKINALKEPYTLSIGQKLKLKEQVKVEQPKTETSNTKNVKEKSVEPVKKETIKTQVVKSEPVKPVSVKRVAIQEITVAPGDTLYSLSRKYQIPVNDLAVMNKMSSPFTLTTGQKLKVPKLDNVETRSATAEKKVAPVKNVVEAKNTEVPKVSQKTKISSDPKKQLPKISARSGNKFSWPIRGKILSQYGAKNGGLFNDGINIGANIGSPVKAAENGVVAYAGNEVKGMGNLIIMQHSDGWMTVYAHLDSMSVRRGTKVSVGQQIGKIGKTGKVDKPQLHFEIRRGTKAFNPTLYLKK